MTEVEVAFEVTDGQTGKTLMNHTYRAVRHARAGGVSLIKPKIERLNDALQEVTQQFVDDLVKSEAK